MGLVYNFIGKIFQNYIILGDLVVTHFMEVYERTTLETVLS